MRKWKSNLFVKNKTDQSMDHNSNCDDSAYVQWFRKWFTVYHKELKEIINPKNYEIMQYRFGNNDSHTIDDTCRHYGISGEKLSKIESKLFQSINRILSQKNLEDQIKQ